MNQDRMSGVLLHVTSLPSLRRRRRLRPGGLRVRRLPRRGEAAALAGSAAQPHRLRQLALLRALRVRRQSHPHLARAPCRAMAGFPPSASTVCPGHDGPADFGAACEHEAAADRRGRRQLPRPRDRRRSVPRLLQSSAARTSPGCPTTPCSTCCGAASITRAGTSGRSSLR